MKKTTLILSAIVILIIGAFLVGKWDQLKYYFRFDNTELTSSLVGLPDSENLQTGIGATYVFDIKNTGSNELRIENILTECECLISDIESKTIDAGESTKVTIQFTPENQGEFIKYAMIEANTAPPFTVMTIEGKVE
jgi:archaellum component FlaG (FlaF/FlaG flagellin family)